MGIGSEHWGGGDRYGMIGMGLKESPLHNVYTVEPPIKDTSGHDSEHQKVTFV